MDMPSPLPPAVRHGEAAIAWVLTRAELHRAMEVPRHPMERLDRHPLPDLKHQKCSSTDRHGIPSSTTVASGKVIQSHRCFSS
uniref:Uncharacterized protein n=1 Tax=Oryza glumipatula TaxID=40148 RepID=A0A0E0BKI0_9ORYZ